MNVEKSDGKVFSSASVLYARGGPRQFAAAVTLFGTFVAGRVDFTRR